MMQRTLGSVLLLGVIMAAPLFAQSHPAQNQPAAKLQAQLVSRFSAALTYSPARATTAGGNSFWLQGGSGQLDYRFWRNLSAAADVGGLRNGNINSSGVELEMTTFTFGPRYAFTPPRNLKHKVSLYGQGLVGVAYGFNSVFPNSNGATSSASSLAALVGGGADLHLTPLFAIRVIEADWLRTQLPDASSGVQNNIRISTGIVYHF